MYFNNRALLFLAIFYFFICDVRGYEVILKNENIKISHIKFSLHSFIDARINKEKPVGFTRIGISNKIEALTLPKDFGSYCFDFFNSTDLKKDNEIRFIVVINQVTIQETHDGAREFSTTSLSLDYFMVDSDYCQLFYSSFVRSQIGLKTDITSAHSSNLTEAFLISLSNLRDYIINGGIFFSDKHVALSGINDSLNKINNMFIRKSAIKDGLYYSCKQVLTNSPKRDKQNFLSPLDTSLKEIVFDEKHPLPNNNGMFAFAKKGALYLCAKKNTFWKVGREDSTNLVYYKDVIRKKASIGAGVAAVGLGRLFGLVGLTVVAGELMGSEIKNAAVKTTRIDKLYVDLETGLMDIEP